MFNYTQIPKFENAKHQDAMQGLSRSGYLGIMCGLYGIFRGFGHRVFCDITIFWEG